MKTQTALTIEGAATPAFNKANQFKWTLTPGWNQIGNPYTFEVDWKEVTDANPGSGGLVLKKYTGSYIDGTSLKAFEGGFVVNSTSNIITLEVPVVGKHSGGRQAARELSYDLEHEDWIAPITLKRESWKINSVVWVCTLKR